MRRTLRIAVTACAVSLGLAASSALVAAPAFAQGGDAAKSVALTQKQIDGLVTAQAELAKLPQGNPEKPDPKVQAKAEAIVKKAGFSGLEEFGAAGDSVDAVLSGLDPETKTFVGQSAMLKKQIAQVEADKKMPAKDKAEALKDLKEAAGQADPPKPPAGNIELVTKNLDKLSQSQGGND